MLFTVTSLVDFVGMCIALWLALYLVGRSFPSRITARAAAVLLALAAFFLGAYVNLYVQVPGTAAVRATLLTVALSVWNDLTHKLLPRRWQRRLDVGVAVVYGLSLITIVLLLGTRDAFVGETGNVLWVARMGLQPPFLIYGVVQLITCASILNHLRLGARSGASIQNRYFTVASWLALATVGYGVLALALTPPMPRLIQDALILTSIAVLGVSVARHQTLVERRTTLRDFPISVLAMLGLSALYIWMAGAVRLPPIAVILVTAAALLTHSTYDLVREFLGRLRSRDENSLRRQLRGLEGDIGVQVSLRERLHSALVILCRTLGSTGGFVAVREAAGFTVIASLDSIPAGETVPVAEPDMLDLKPAPEALGARAAWLAPGFQGGQLTALLGLGRAKVRAQYSEDDLDLLAETADRIASIVHLEGRMPADREQLARIAVEARSHAADLQARSEDLMASIAAQPDPGFLKAVEDGLRSLSDVIALGQSPLTGRLRARGGTHIERGKNVQQRLMQAVESLRPAGDQPKGAVPREWYSFVVLHDAYWEGIANRDIMSRLYISEGTFNRTRRAAIRAVARALLESGTAA